MSTPTPAELAKLLETSGYTEDAAAPLVAYISSNQEYSFEACRRLLKIYQFIPNAVDKEMYAKVLLLGLVQYPSTDHSSLASMVPDQTEEPVANIVRYVSFFIFTTNKHPKLNHTQCTLIYHCIVLYTDARTTWMPATFLNFGKNLKHWKPIQTLSPSPLGPLTGCVPLFVQFSLCLIEQPLLPSWRRPWIPKRLRAWGENMSNQSLPQQLPSRQRPTTPNEAMSFKRESVLLLLPIWFPRVFLSK